MQITKVSFPQQDVCCVEVKEEAASYEALIQKFYEENKKFFPVRGYAEGTAPREVIEQQYGAQAFRLDVINHLLVYEYPALQSVLCNVRGLTPLTEAEPRLVSDDDTGFVVECTFALVPQLAVTGYTGNTLPGGRLDGTKQLLDQVAEQSGLQPCEYAVQVEAANRLEALQAKLREANANMADFLKQTGKTEQQVREDLRQMARQDLAQKIALLNITRQEGLAATEQQVDAEIERMVAISEQNAYARTNPTARRSIAARLSNQRTLEWLAEHNHFEQQ